MAVKRIELSKEEVSQRTAVLRRFKELLKAQRDRFRNYIEILDKQKNTIEHGSADELIRHVELEEKIVADIFSIQKVIDPMEEMYKAARIMGPVMPAAPLEADNVDSLKSALEGLKAEAISRSERNKNLLSKRMVELRAEIKNIRANPYARQRNAYSDSAAPTLVDIRG
jgi:hypothetical protein